MQEIDLGVDIDRFDSVEDYTDHLSEGLNPFRAMGHRFQGRGAGVRMAAVSMLLQAFYCIRKVGRSPATRNFVSESMKEISTLVALLVQGT